MSLPLSISEGPDSRGICRILRDIVALIVEAEALRAPAASNNVGSQRMAPSGSSAPKGSSPANRLVDDLEVRLQREKDTIARKVRICARRSDHLERERDKTCAEIAATLDAGKIPAPTPTRQQRRRGIHSRPAGASVNGTPQVKAHERSLDTAETVD